jgi:hypothetical protein
MVFASKNATNNSTLSCGYFQNDSLVVKIMAYKMASRYTVQRWGKWKCIFTSTSGLGTHTAPLSIMEQECFPKSKCNWSVKLKTHIILRLRVSRTFISLLPGSSWRSVILSDFISCCVMERNLWDDNSSTSRHDPRATLVHPKPGNSSAHPQTLRYLSKLHINSIRPSCLSPKLPLAFTFFH